MVLMKIVKSRAILAFAMVVATAVSMPAVAECDDPSWAGTIPDGATASKKAMLETAESIRQYDDEVNSYASCLALETAYRIAAIGGRITQEQLRQLRYVENRKRNAAVDALNARADQFNEQVRIYNARQDRN
jgi:hypothetical protein